MTTASVTVVIPTYHRPDYLRSAVRAVQDQVLPPGWEVEIIIAVSDKDAVDDIAAAEELAQDARVRFVVADRPGPAAARNAALRTSRGQAVAFTDDDCVPQPGWLRLSLAALDNADIVQGSTVAAGPIPPMGYSVNVDPPSWLWETCNLVVDRRVIDRVGLFDEEWNPTGEVGSHFGEDLEWAWRLIRSGARPAFVPEARVEHAVFERGLEGMVRYELKLRHFPETLRRVPEIRRHFYLNYFVNRRHVVLTASAALFALGALAAARGNWRFAGLSLPMAVALWARPIYPEVQAMRGAERGLAKDLFWITRDNLAELRTIPPLSGLSEGTYLGVFASRRQAVFIGSIGLAIGSVTAASQGHNKTAVLGALAAAVGWMAPLRVRRDWFRGVGRAAGRLAAQESAQFFPLLFENVRQRRVLL